MKILTPTASFFIPARAFVLAGLVIAFPFSCLLVRNASMERENTRQREQAVSAQSDATQHVDSPEIKVLNNQRISISVPGTWTVYKQSAARDWQTTEYDFEMRPHISTDPPNASREVGVAILFYSHSRAERHGDLEGAKFKTKQGLTGVLATYKTENGKESRLAIPVQNTSDMVVLFGVGDMDQSGTNQQIIQTMLKSVRILPALSNRQSNDQQRAVRTP